MRLFGQDYAFGDRGLVKRPVPAPTRSPASRHHELSQILDCEAKKGLARKPRLSRGQGRVRSGAVGTRPSRTNDIRAAFLDFFAKNDQTIAPYKYPRAVHFVEALPKTQTGKIQRFRLRQP